MVCRKAGHYIAFAHLKPFLFSDTIGAKGDVSNVQTSKENLSDTEYPGIYPAARLPAAVAEQAAFGGQTPRPGG